MEQIEANIDQLQSPETANELTKRLGIMQAEEAVVLSPNQEKNKARDIEEIVSKLWI